MRPHALTTLTLAVLLSAACSSKSSTGTCDGACAHYLKCKSADNPENRNACLPECAKRSLSADELRQFEQTDCAAAIAQVEEQSGGGGGTAGGGGGSNDCQGCVWDGTSCTYYSQGNWGAGAFSGAAIGCDAKCCQ